MRYNPVPLLKQHYRRATNYFISLIGPGQLEQMIELKSNEPEPSWQEMIEASKLWRKEGDYLTTHRFIMDDMRIKPGTYMPLRR